MKRSVRSTTISAAPTIGTAIILVLIFPMVLPLDALSVGAGNRGGARRRTRPPPPFSSFQFAPNGVCTQPAFFVDPENGGGDDDQRQQQQRRLFTMRNVPGHGDCMFLAVALATACSMGLGANDVLLNAIARETRAVVASLLEQSLVVAEEGDSSPTSSSTLVVTGKRLVTARKLLRSAAKDCNLSEADYLRQLRLTGREGGLYGGGPELTVLTNVLRRPISIYELAPTAAATTTTSSDDTDNDDSAPATTTTIQPIACRGVFGADIFDDPLRRVPGSAVLGAQPRGAYSWHLHILVVDSSAEEKHACVLLPQ